jgi:predicted LPLAT superfamily acyltransferase
MTTSGQREETLTGTGWTSQQERSSPFWLKAIIGIYRLLGRRVCEWLLYPISLYFFLFSGSGRRSSIEFLGRFGSRSYSGVTGWIRLRADSYRNFLEFSRALLDKFSVWQGHISLGELKFHGRELLRNLISARQGAVVISAHLGNIEVLRAIAQDELNRIKVNALMFTKHNPGFNSILRASNPESHLRIIPTEDPGPELIIDLRERIAAGEVVAMLGDRLLPGSSERSVRVPFGGSEANFPAGPFVLASLLECPVILVFCFRDAPRSYSIHFESLSDRIILPRATRTEALEATVRKFAERLEFYCRRYPSHWFNFFDFWR